MTNDYKLISSTDELNIVCQEIEGEEFITIDTEFLREKTYFPELCLIQIASGSGKTPPIAIDVVSKNIDISAFYKILLNKNIIKVIHAGGQDMEMFYNHMNGELPYPVFDTQIAASVCGMGEQVGYENIVRNILNKHIDKSQQFTDWSKRPLTEKQLQYAISDVTYLREVYLRMINEIIPEKRLPWIEEEINLSLLNKDKYHNNPETSWKRLKKRVKKPDSIKRLKALTTWRENLAIDENRPRGWILHDDAIVEIANTNPKSKDELSRIRAINKRRGKLDYDLILNITKDAKNLPDIEMSSPKERLEKNDVAKDFLRLILQKQCEEHKIAVRMVANTDDINEFLNNNNNVRFMHGWRYEIFGKLAEKARNGDINLKLDNKGNLNIIATEH